MHESRRVGGGDSGGGGKGHRATAAALGGAGERGGVDVKGSKPPPAEDERQGQPGWLRPGTLVGLQSGRACQWTMGCGRARAGIPPPPCGAHTAQYPAEIASRGGTARANGSHQAP